MPDSRIDFSVTVHGVPTRADAGRTLGAPLKVCFGAGFHPDVTIFTDDQALTNALAAAINGVLAQHKPAEEGV